MGSEDGSPFGLPSRHHSPAPGFYRRQRGAGKICAPCRPPRPHGDRTSLGLEPIASLALRMPQLIGCSFPSRLGPIRKAPDTRGVTAIARLPLEIWPRVGQTESGGFRCGPPSRRLTSEAKGDGRGLPELASFGGHRTRRLADPSKGATDRRARELENCEICPQRTATSPSPCSTRSPSAPAPGRCRSLACRGGWRGACRRRPWPGSRGR